MENDKQIKCGEFNILFNGFNNGKTEGRDKQNCRDRSEEVLGVMCSSCRKTHPATNGWTSAYFKTVKIRDIPHHRHLRCVRKKRCRACYNRSPPDISCKSKYSLPDPVLHECTSKSNEHQLVTVHGSNLRLLARILNRRLRKNPLKHKYCHNPSCLSASSQPFVGTDENVCCQCHTHFKRLVPATPSDCPSCPSLPHCRSTHQVNSQNPEDCNKIDDSPYNKPIQLFMFLNTPHPEIHIKQSATDIETCANTCVSPAKLPSTDKDDSPQSQVDEVISEGTQVDHPCAVNIQQDLLSQPRKTTIYHREVYAQQTTSALCDTASSELPQDNQMHNIDRKVINISSKGKMRFNEVPERIQSKTTNDNIKLAGVDVQLYQSRPTTKRETLRKYDNEDALRLTSRHPPDSAISNQEEKDRNNPELNYNIQQDVSERSKEISPSNSSLSKGINEISSSLLNTSSLDELIGIIQDWWKKNKSYLKSQAADNPSSLASSRTFNTGASYFSDEVPGTTTSISASTPLERRIKTKESDNVWSNSAGSSLHQETGYSDVSTSEGTVSFHKAKKFEFRGYYPHFSSASNEYLYGERMLYNNDEPCHRGKHYGHPALKPTSPLDKYTQLNYYDDPTYRFRDYEYSAGGTYDFLSNTVLHTNEFYRNYNKATHQKDEFLSSNNAPKLFGNCEGTDLLVNKDIPYTTTYSLYDTSNVQQKIAGNYIHGYHDIRAVKETQTKEPCRTFVRYPQPSELRPTNTFLKFQYDKRRELSGNAPVYDNCSMRPSQANEIPVLANVSLRTSDEHEGTERVKLPIGKAPIEKNAELNATKGSFRNERYSCITSPILNHSRESPAPKTDGASHCDTVQCTHQFLADESYQQSYLKPWTDISSYDRTRNITQLSNLDTVNNINSNQQVPLTDYSKSSRMLKNDSASDPASNSVLMPISIVPKENRHVSLPPIIQSYIKTTNIYQNNNCSLAILPVAQIVDLPSLNTGTNETEFHDYQTPTPPELSAVGESLTSLDEQLLEPESIGDPISPRCLSSDRNITRLKEILRDAERLLFQIADEYPPSAHSDYKKVRNTTIQRNDINRYSRIDILKVIVHSNTFHPLQSRSFLNDSCDTREQSYNSVTSSEVWTRSPSAHQSDVEGRKSIFNWGHGPKIETPISVGQSTGIPITNDSLHSNTEIILHEEDLSRYYSQVSDIRPQNAAHSPNYSSGNSTICENSSFYNYTLNTAVPNAAQNLSLLPVSGRDVRTIPTGIADYSSICHQQTLPISLPTFNASKADTSVMCNRRTCSSKDISVKYILIPVQDSAVSSLGSSYGRQKNDSSSTNYQSMTKQSSISNGSGACCISLLSDNLDIPTSSEISNSCHNKNETVQQEASATLHSWQEKCQKICQIPLSNLLTMKFQDSSRFEFGSDKHSHFIAPTSILSNENTDRTSEVPGTSSSIKSTNSPNFVPNLQTDIGVNTEFPILTYDSQFNHILEKDKRKQQKKKQLKIKKLPKEKSSPFSILCVPITSRNVGPSSQPCRERRDLIISQEGAAKKPKSKSSRK